MFFFIIFSGIITPHGEKRGLQDCGLTMYPTTFLSFAVITDIRLLFLGKYFARALPISPPTSTLIDRDFFIEIICEV